MRIVICDITGRTINYDAALCEALNEEKSNGDNIEFWCAGLKDSYLIKTHNFFSLVPEKYRSIAHPVTKVLKAFDTLLAYNWILLHLLLRRIDVLHLQWFPFISLGTTGSGIDMFYIRLMKLVSPKTKLVYTIHNMCPHSMREGDRPKYNPTFSKALKLFDNYVVHTERTKQEVVEVLNLNADDIEVIYHGIFTPQNYKFAPVDLTKSTLNIIMYGFQNPYKGTDVFVEGLKCIKKEYKSLLRVIVCGAFEGDYLKQCKAVDTGIETEWIPKFLSDEELYNQISKSDLIILPYRRISQSGVLLLALSTKRLIVTSKLPTFVETLKGFEEKAFFESENPNDLARVIEGYLTGEISKSDKIASIEKLNNLYSWNESAKKTLSLYNK